MWKPIAALWLLAALALAGTVAADVAHAQGAVSTSSGVAITSVPVRAPLETAEARFTDVALHLIGAPSAESFGVSLRATILPKLDLTGKEQAVAYLYATCDDDPPARSGGVPLAVIELGDLKAGRASQTIIASVTQTSPVPLTNVACAKLTIVCKECAEPGTPVSLDVARSLPALVGESATPVAVGQLAVTLFGEPGSKSFGLSYDGTVTPTEDLAGKEKLVVNLYADCGGTPPVPGTFVGAVEIAELPAGRAALTLKRAADVTSLVPFSRIACARVALACPTCEPPSKPADYKIRKLDLATQTGIRDLRLDDLSLTLVGEPSSKSFGVAFHGTVNPEVAMTGSEKLVLRLYTGCAGSGPPGPDATNVATVELGTLRTGGDPYPLATTKDGTAFVPMQDIGCALIDVE